jgi:hypothetical protein
MDTKLLNKLSRMENGPIPKPKVELSNKEKSQKHKKKEFEKHLKEYYEQ